MCLHICSCLGGTGAQVWAVPLTGCAISANIRDFPAANMGLLQRKGEKVEGRKGVDWPQGGKEAVERPLRESG